MQNKEAKKFIKKSIKKFEKRKLIKLAKDDKIE